MATKTLSLCLLAAAGGSLLEKKVVERALPSLYEPSEVVGLPRAFGIVLLLLIVFSFWLTAYGMKVGRARSVYREKAAKDGEKDLDRFNIPNLYVYGTSANAKAFNSVQRSHQQIFESLTQFYTTSLIAALCFPVITAISCFVWCWARMAWAQDYAQHGPTGRYNHFLSRFIWYSLITNYLLAMISAGTVVLGPLY